jgi:hypothetical protein
MKLIFTLLYCLIMFIMVSVLFYAFRWISIFVVHNLLIFYHSLNHFLFWVLYLLIGSSIISIIWNSFRIIVALIIPYPARLKKIYIDWCGGFTRAISWFSGISYTIKIWKANGWNSFITILFCFAVSIVTIKLISLIIKVSDKSLNAIDHRFNDFYEINSN